MASPAKSTAISPHRGTVALLAIDDASAEQLEKDLGPGYTFRAFDNHEPMVSALGLGSLAIDALVIGPGVEDPLEIAASVSDQLKHIQIIVLADGQDVSAFERRAEMQSNVGDEIGVWPTQEMDELPQKLKKAIKRAHRRVRRAERTTDDADPRAGNGNSEVIEHLERLLEHAPIGMLTINDSDEIVSLNRQARTIIGEDRGGLINHRIFEFFPDFEQKKLRELLARDRAGDGAESGARSAKKPPPSNPDERTVVLRLDSENPGDARHVELIGAGRVGRNGGSCTMLILHDVSSIVRAEIAQRRTAAALQASEDRFYELADVMRMIPWEADPRTMQFTFIGRLAEDVLGYPPSDWLNSDLWSTRLHPEDRERAFRTIQRNARRLQNFNFEFRMLAADGSQRWLRNVVNVVRDEDGMPTKLRGFLVDVTEQKYEHDNGANGADDGDGHH